MTQSLIHKWLPYASLALTGLLSYASVLGQCPTAPQLWDKLITIERDPVMSIEQRLKEVMSLKATFEDCGLPPDSVYARILHRLGVFQNSMQEPDLSIRNTLQSVAINTSGRKGACLRCAVRSFLNLGLYYRGLLFYDEAIRYLDTAASLAARYPDQKNFLVQSREASSNIFDLKGDYQHCVEEASRGLQDAEILHDTVSIIVLLNQRAFAYAQQSSYQPAISDASMALTLSTFRKDYDGEAGSLKAKAKAMESGGDFTGAFELYKEAIKSRIQSKDSDRLCEDYLDAGNLLLYKMGRYDEAENYCRKAASVSSAEKAYTMTANAFNSIGSIDFYKGNYILALGHYRQALTFLRIETGTDNLTNPASRALDNVQDKQVLLHPFGNKTECLLHLYKQTRRPEYLSACLQTALLTDTLISAMRHEQTGDQSKLYWRNQTREFFSNALEACWLAGDTKLAFYFMEKSRAVLLNDKLNELGAFAFLPAAEAAREQSLQINIIGQQQALAQMNADSPGYQTEQGKFLQAKDEFEKYIKTLEQKAPAYYQYKYADDVPSLDSLKRFLSRNQQSFIHYFINDTVAYILGISGTNARLLKLPYRGINNKLGAFLQICSDKEMLNGNYDQFALLSHSIYQDLFQPLQMPKGRVVISPDNFLIPFEALCTDSRGRHFLVYDYTFDYVYSARVLLKSFHNPEGKGNFLGLAPGSFEAYLHVPDLQQSVASIQTAASCYSGHTCQTGPGTTRRYFMAEAPDYTIVNVYSHARADSGDNEPLLFMADSVIHLSELQLLQHPAAQLVVLSACQTNAGKNAAGEGIYSLARGFASAGIPSVASTLWQADEQATYQLTEQFHRNLAKGLRKDEALQQAKLYYIRAGGNENLLPYYWANMILIGNADPVRLSPDHHILWLAAGLLCLLLLFLGFYRVKHHTGK